MPYRLVKGKFHLSYQGERHVGSQPDGDTVWFKPEIPKNLDNLDHRSAKLNGGGCTQLRFVVRPDGNVGNCRRHGSTSWAPPQIQPQLVLQIVLPLIVPSLPTLKLGGKR